MFSLRISLRWSIHVIKLVDKPNCFEEGFALQGFLALRKVITGHR